MAHLRRILSVAAPRRSGLMGPSRMLLALLLEDRTEAGAKGSFLRSYKRARRVVVWDI